MGRRLLADFGPRRRKRARGLLRWGRARAAGDESVANLGDRRECEAPRARPYRERADSWDGAVDGVVADDAPVPCARDQFVVANDLAVGARERDEHLHDPRLERGGRARGYDLARGGADFEDAESEPRLVGQHDRISALRSSRHQGPRGTSRPPGLLVHNRQRGGYRAMRAWAASGACGRPPEGEVPPGERRSSFSRRAPVRRACDGARGPAPPPRTRRAPARRARAPARSAAPGPIRPTC